MFTGFETASAARASTQTYPNIPNKNMILGINPELLKINGPNLSA